MEFSWDVILVCLLIVAARVTDVSIGILRLIFVVRGHRFYASFLGFVEALIWVYAIAKVTAHLDKPIYMISFALGFALGNFVGLTIEKKFAYGQQVLRIFTRFGDQISEELRDSGYKVTKFNGHGRGGPIDMLLTKLQRKQVNDILEQVKKIDDRSFYFVDEITLTSDATQGPMFVPGIFRLKRK